MGDPNWFSKKWGTPEVPSDILFRKIEELEQKLMKLEEENVEIIDRLCENAKHIEAVDARIDILAEHCGITEDV